MSVFEKSTKTFMQDPEKHKEIEIALELIKKKYDKREIKEIDEETCLKLNEKYQRMRCEG